MKRLRWHLLAWVPPLVAAGIAFYFIEVIVDLKWQLARSQDDLKECRKAHVK